MGSRGLLVALIVAATAAFVVGTAIERSSTGESGHNEATTAARERPKRRSPKPAARAPPRTPTRPLKR
jgi:hypothetical protein